MPAEKPTEMRPAAKRVIEAMRAVRLANKELTTRNIAAQLGIQVQTVGASLQRMLKEGLIRRHGMILEFDGKNRNKNMLWRINTLLVREIEKREQTMEAGGAPSAMLKVPPNKRAKQLQDNKVRDAGQLV